MIDGHLYKGLSRGKNKSIDGLNISRKTDKLTERVSNLEILQDKDQSFSTKGPVVPKNEIMNPWNIDEEVPIGRKSEDLKNIQPLDKEIGIEKVENENLKEYLENKISKSKKEIQELSRQAEKEKDDLVAFPSEDEQSKKQKNDIINDIESIESDTDMENQKIDFENADMKQLECKIDESPKIEPGGKDIKFNPGLKSITSIQKSDGEKLVSVFPSLADKTNNQDSERIMNSDILNDISNENQNQNNFLCNENLLDIEGEEEGNSIHSEGKKLDASSINSEPPAKEILLSSSRSNIISGEGEERKSNPNLYVEEPNPFNENEQEKNKFDPPSDQPVDENIPELPSNLDINDISEVMPPPEPEEEENKGKLIC